MHIDSKARPSRIAAETGRDKRVPPGSPGTSRSPDATSASLPDRRSAAKSRPFREGWACPVRNRPHGISTGMDLCGVFCTCHTAWRTLRQDPEETKGRGFRRAPRAPFRASSFMFSFTSQIRVLLDAQERLEEPSRRISLVEVIRPIDGDASLDGDHAVVLTTIRIR